MSIIKSETYQKSIQRIAKSCSTLEGNILITGATGLIGSCLIDSLICAVDKYGNRIKIIAISRNYNALKERFGYVKPGIVSLVAHNVINPITITEPIEYIVHAASYADPISYLNYPAETMLTNILGIYHLLEYCKMHTNTRLLFTSSFEVYGNRGGKDIFAEEDSGEIELNTLRSCYPESKRSAELLLRGYHYEYHVDGVIARLNSIYGPTMTEKDSKAHAQFIRNGIAKKNIVMKSEGRQRRSYCYIMDAISGLLTILQYGKSGEVYNISNENSIASIRDVANTVADICKVKVIQREPNLTERQSFSFSRSCILDNNLLRGLGWEGQYSLHDGLSETITILNEIKSK